MRELFDEVAGQSPFDPEEAVRRATRTPQRKRFYTIAGVAPAPGGFAVTLDDKPVRTPSRQPLVAPTREIAEAIAAEWEAQRETIDPLTMPLTRFANSVAEVGDHVDAVAEDAAKYLGTDLLFYRAGQGRVPVTGIADPQCVCLLRQRRLGTLQGAAARPRDRAPTGSV